jgi:hypothetical protein
VRFHHGGRLWRCGAIIVTIHGGVLGRSSLGERARICSTSIGGRPANIARGYEDHHGQAMTLWFPDDSRLPVTTVGASSKRPEDLPLLQAIVLSTRPAPKRQADDTPATSGGLSAAPAPA